MNPLRATLGILPLLGLLACGGGGSSAPTAAAAPPSPEVFVRDRSTATPRLLGMAADGTGSVVLVPDATKLGLGLRTSQGLAYGLTGASYTVQQLRMVGLDGRGDRLLHTVDDTLYRLYLMGEAGGHLLLFLQHSGYYYNRVESLPLAGGAPVTWSTQGSFVAAGTSTLLYTAGGEYRLGQLAAGTSQVYPADGGLNPLPTGGFLMGSGPANALATPLTLLTGDFARVRELAPVGAVLPPVGTRQALDPGVVATAEQLFGQIPNGEGRALMAYPRSGGPAVLLDATSATGARFGALGLAGSRLAYQLSTPDAEPGFTRVAYRVVPVAGGTPVELTPLARRDDATLLGLTSLSLVEAMPGTGDQVVLRFFPLDGTTPTEVVAWSLAFQEVQARVVGDRVAYVTFDGATYRLMSVDARGQGAKVHLESTTAIYGEFLNGTEVAHGRMCFTRGNDLFLLDPLGAAPTLLHTGTTPGYFAGWVAQRVLYSFTENGQDALWSARQDGTDKRQLTANGSLTDIR